MNDAANNAEPGRAEACLAIDPHILRPATFPPFDLYVCKNGDGALSLFRKANEPVYANTWNKLERGGFDTVYVRGEDRGLCFDYVADNLSGILTEDVLPPSASAEWVYRLACRAMEDLFREPDSLRGYNRVRELAGAAALLARRHPGVEWDMVDCAPLAYSTHSHCVNVAVLLMGFATRVLGVADTDLLSEIALGGMLHDLGKAMIPSEILTKPAALTRREFAQVKKHPRYGVKIAQPFLRQAPIAQCVIAQHHENSSGDGYPDGRSGESINTFARAARMADAFDALTSQRPYGAALDPYRALNVMVNEMRGQFDMPMLRKFIKHLGSHSDAEEPVTVQAPAEAAVPTPPAPEAASAAPEPAAPAVEVAATVGAGPDETPAGQPPVAVVPRRVVRAVPLEADAGAPTEPIEGGPEATQTAAEAPPAVPVARAAEPGPAAAADATLQEKLDALRELSEEQSQHAAFMGDLLGALKSAFAGPLGRAFRSEEAQAAAAVSPKAEVAIARDLFPLVWQLDEWRSRFLERTPPVPDALRLRAEVLACLGALRESIVAILRAHNVEVVEEMQEAGAALSAEQPRSAADPRRVRRVGFIHREGSACEVLEPARIVLYADLRKAG